MSLSNKIVLVTGASRGIGSGIALALAKQGAYVVGTATSQAGADSISAQLQVADAQGTGMVLNVCEEDSVNAIYDALKEANKLPNILINNAGITRDNILLRMKPDQWNEVIETNLSAIYRITKKFLKPMLKARWGRVINITSVVGVTGNPGQANYCAAKAGLIGFSKSLAQELAQVGITINCVAPGFIETDMTNSLNNEQKEQIFAQIPMRKMGKVDDVAAAVAFLAAPAAGYITGQTLHVNGGMAMV